MAVETESETDGLHAKWQYGRLVPMPAAVPSGWSFRKVTDVARLESGHTPSRKHPEYWAGDIPWVSLHDSKGLDRAGIDVTAQTIGELGLANSSARMLPAGTVVFSRTATVGKATILGREMATSQDFANYICGSDIHNRFLMHLLRFLQPEWKRLMAGSTHNTIYMPVFENLQVLLPPGREQRKIAAILSSVDDAIEATQAVIDQLQVVKKAMMAELLTRGLPGRHTKFKTGPTGDVPASWEVKPCGDLFELQLGKMMSVEARTGPTQLPYLRNENVYWHRLELSDVSTMHFENREREKFRLRQGDLLACEGRHIGRCAVWNGELDECYFQKALHRLRSKSDDVSTLYMQYFMMLRFRFMTDLVAEANATSTIPHLPREKLLMLPVWLPPRGEQDKIVDMLASMSRREAVEHQSLDGLGELKEALMSVLLTGEVRVKPDEEAA